MLFIGTIESKIMMMYVMFAETERDLICQRTKGQGKSKLDKFRPEVEASLKNGSQKPQSPRDTKQLLRICTIG